MPSLFVVKNGSKMRACVSEAHPDAFIFHGQPDVTVAGRARSAGSGSNSVVRRVIRPPCGIASRAFAARDSG